MSEYFNYGSELEQNFGKFAIDYIKNNVIFIDNDNPSTSKSNKWVHVKEKIPDYSLFPNKPGQSLSAMINARGIKQGGFGDCYFLSAIAAIVEKYP